MRKQRVQRLYVLVAFGLVALSAQSAAAFCPARTCNRSTQNCAEDQDGCLVSGEPIAWLRKEVTVSIDPAGSVRLGISAEQTAAALERAFQSWQQASCPSGQNPSISLRIADAPAGNMSASVGILTYLDADWPHEPSYGALTKLSLDLNTGEILGAMMEINSETHALAVDASAPAIDLDAVLTHEVGHLLGLDHTKVPGATMVRETVAFGSHEMRSLEADDIAGVCALYPPREAERKHDDKSETKSSCAVTPEAPRRNMPWLFAFGALALACFRRARPTKVVASTRPWKTL